ncbi:hypothetical protein QYE76_008156 [Lolium multiflorum]|uniref:Uncharacterized protein n=1 Tax=Lolium multiflorum TaxID=4521 RepID=A0AAD8VBN2_LOLMU|nr:hypothetical protein QYE76_008156 [Lolium multiflorum]
MYGPGDPTKITGLPLSKKDVVLKARQICQTSMPENWEWGLRPLSSTNPPTQEAKDRFPGIESDKRGRCRKRGLDKFDPDPVIFWKDLKMGRTPAASWQSSAGTFRCALSNLNPQVHEHVAPLQAEAGKEFVDKLMAQARRTRRARCRLKPSSSCQTLPDRARRGPALKLGPRPEGSAARRDLNSSSHSSPAPCGCRNTSASPPGHNKFGRAAPYTADPRAEEDFDSSRDSKTPAPATWAPTPKMRKLLFLPSLRRRKGRRPTRGLGKDRLPAPDPAGPRSTEEHFTRLKRAVKEFDSTWYDATANVVSTADARKALFEELLWEHRSLAEAHSKCLAIPEASIEALKDQVAKLQAEKEQLIRDHEKALDAQKEISRELKDQAMQAGPRAKPPKRTKLPRGGQKAQKAAKSEVVRLKAEQKEYDLLVTRTDALALRLFPDSQAHAIKKVGEHRAQQAGDNLGAPWDPYDHLVVLSARSPTCARGSEPFRHP